MTPERRDEANQKAFRLWRKQHLQYVPTYFTAEERKIHLRRRWDGMTMTGRRYWLKKVLSPSEIKRRRSGVPNEWTPAMRADVHSRRDYGVKFTVLAAEYDVTPARIAQVYQAEVKRFLAAGSEPTLIMRVQVR